MLWTARWNFPKARPFISSVQQWVDRSFYLYTGSRFARLHRLLARHRAQRPGLTSNWARRRRADSEGRERNERHEGEALFAEAILRVAQPRWAALFAQRSDASLALFIEATQPRDGRAGLRCVTERSFGPPSRSDPPKGRTPGGIRRSACGENTFWSPEGRDSIKPSGSVATGGSNLSVLVERQLGAPAEPALCGLWKKRPPCI